MQMPVLTAPFPGPTKQGNPRSPTGGSKFGSGIWPTQSRASPPLPTFHTTTASNLATELGGSPAAVGTSMWSPSDFPRLAVTAFIKAKVGTALA